MPTQPWEAAWDYRPGKGPSRLLCRLRRGLTVQMEAELAAYFEKLNITSIKLQRGQAGEVGCEEVGLEAVKRAEGELAIGQALLHANSSLVTTKCHCVSK